MKGLLWKDCLTIRKKYGLPRLVLDLAILAALLVVLEGTGALVVSLLLVPLEVTSMVISLTSFDETWKWDKYAAALPVSQAEIVKSRYAFALLMPWWGLWWPWQPTSSPRPPSVPGVWGPACWWRWPPSS